MNLDEYQQKCTSTAIYPSELGIYYTSLGLCSEAGEVADKIKKNIRDCGGELSEEDVDALSKELGDVLWYVSMLGHELGLSLEEIASKNLEKLNSRSDREMLGGSGDDR